MNKWDELNDFSEFEGTLPCILCKADSSKTILGGHWKCSVCGHVFNEDGSALKIQCYCETCAKKQQQEPQLNIEDAIKQLEALKKKPKKKSKKKKK